MLKNKWVLNVFCASAVQDRGLCVPPICVRTLMGREGFPQLLWRPLGEPLCRLWGILGLFWGGIWSRLWGFEAEVARERRSGSALGLSGRPSWAVPWRLLGQSWAVLRQFRPVLGQDWGYLGPSWGHLGPSWVPLGALE